METKNAYKAVRSRKPKSSATISRKPQSSFNIPFNPIPTPGRLYYTTDGQLITDFSFLRGQA